MKTIIFILLFVLIAGCATDTARTDLAQSEASEAGEMLIVEFRAALKSELVQALTEGGPENAITVCYTKASEVAEGISAMPGVEVRRVSLNQRNTGYSSDEFERIVLETFKATAAENPQVHVEQIKEGDEIKAIRYMKEIRTGEMCLKCHGDPATFSDGLKAKLAEFYPEDPATGYKAGESRGAFSVIFSYPDAIASIKKILAKSAH